MRHLLGAFDQTLNLRAEAWRFHTPALLRRTAAQQLGCDRALVCSSRKCIVGTEHQQPSSRARLVGKKRAAEPARPPEREQTPERQHLPLGQRKAGELIPKLSRTARDRARQHVDSDGPKPVGDKQMLAIAGGRNQSGDRTEALKVEDVPADRRAGLNAEHIGVNLCPPDWPSLGCGQPRRLERVQAPSFGCLETPFGRCPIASIPPEPFPREKRAVGLEQWFIGRRIPPVR